MKRLIALAVAGVTLTIGLATHNIGYYNSIPVAGTLGNAGVYAGIGTDLCVGYEFKPYAGFFVGCE